MKRPTIFFDLETGGTKPAEPDIQLAAIAVRGWEEVSMFERKIEFNEGDCDPEALQMNSYDPDIWEANAVPESQVVVEFGEWLRPFCWIRKTSQRGKNYSIARLAGHNAARFDAPRLRAMFKRHGQFLPAAGYEVLDTWQRAIWYFDERGELPPEKFRLAFLCEHFGIPVGETHDALEDARLAAQVARCLCAGP